MHSAALLSLLSPFACESPSHTALLSCLLRQTLTRREKVKEKRAGMRQFDQVGQTDSFPVVQITPFNVRLQISERTIYTGFCCCCLFVCLFDCGSDSFYVCMLTLTVSTRSSCPLSGKSLVQTLFFQVGTNKDFQRI